MDDKKCPKCGSENFGIGTGEPVTVGGWYGDKRFAWGTYARVRIVGLTGLRCGDCKHVVPVDPGFDRD